MKKKHKTIRRVWELSQDKALPFPILLDEKPKPKPELRPLKLTKNQSFLSSKPAKSHFQMDKSKKSIADWSEYSTKFDQDSIISIPQYWEMKEKEIVLQSLSNEIDAEDSSIA